MEVTALGYGFDDIYTGYEFSHLQDESIIGGSVMSNSVCNNAYQNAPNTLAPYSGTLVQDELFCFNDDDSMVAKQVCEVT